MLQLKLKGHPALSQIAEEVPHGESIGVLVVDMFDMMCRKKGIGLAANQVGVLKRVIVVHANGFRQEFINPVITKRYGGKATSREGCLSFPFITVPMVRDKQIIVEGYTKDWKPIKRKLKGLAAYCVQHEIDHLNGITIQ